MEKLPKKFLERMARGLKTYQAITESQRKRDVSEADMVLDAINTFHQRSQLLNKFTVAQLLLSENVIGVVRRDFRRYFPDLKVSAEQVQELLWNEVLKREVLEGDKVKEAQSRIKRAVNKLAKAAERALANAGIGQADGGTKRLPE